MEWLALLRLVHDYLCETLHLAADLGVGGSTSEASCCWSCGMISRMNERTVVEGLLSCCQADSCCCPSASALFETQEKSKATRIL